MCTLFDSFKILLRSIKDCWLEKYALCMLISTHGLQYYEHYIDQSQINSWLNG